MMRHTFLDMAIKESRIPENKRVYQGEETAEALVNWLNFSTEVEAKKRIQNVVALFLELFFFSRAMRKPLASGGPHYAPSSPVAGR